MGPTCRSVGCTFCIMSLRVPNRFECSEMRCEASDLYFTAHPRSARTFKVVQNSQRYNTKRVTDASTGLSHHPHHTNELCSVYGFVLDPFPWKKCLSDSLKPCFSDSLKSFTYIEGVPLKWCILEDFEYFWTILSFWFLCLSVRTSVRPCLRSDRVRSNCYNSCNRICVLLKNKNKWGSRSA